MFLIKSKRTPHYEIIYFVDGKRKSKSTGERKKGKALDYLSNFKENLKKKEHMKTITLEEFKTEYLLFVGLSFSNNYYNICKNSLTVFIRSVGNLDLEDIRPATIERFILEIFKRAKHSASLHFRTLKAAFSKAVEWKYLMSNPFKSIKLPRIEKPLPCYINQTQFESLLKHVPNPTLREIYILLFHTGLRANEVLNLFWTDINFQERTLTVSNKINFSTKNKKERSVPMNETVYNLLLNKYNSQKIFSIQNNYIFTKLLNIKFLVGYISKKFKTAVRQAGLNDKVHLHSLRHSFCSNLVSKGVSLYVVKELAGHENITTTQIYSHLQKGTLREAVNLLD